MGGGAQRDVRASLPLTLGCMGCARARGWGRRNGDRCAQRRKAGFQGLERLVRESQVVLGSFWLGHQTRGIALVQAGGPW